jgi:hypothetical protein
MPKYVPLAERKTLKLEVRVSPDEKRALEALAAKEGTTVSGLVRALVGAARPTPPPPSTAPETAGRTSTCQHGRRPDQWCPRCDQA